MCYTKHVGEKFNKEGQPLDFFGNTIICFLNEEDSVIYNELVYAQDELKKSSFSHKYAIIPPATFHMTVKSLINITNFDQNIKLADIDSKFKNIIESISTPDKFKMKIECCNDYRFILSPYDEKTNQSIKQYREEVSNKVGIKSDNHDSYIFHITLFYRLQELTPTEREELEIITTKINKRLNEKIEYFYTDTPKFVIFNNMFGFYEDLSLREI